MSEAPKTITWTDKVGQTHTATIISEADQVTPELLEVAEQTYEDWFSNESRIDWESFLDRMADPYGFHGHGGFDFEEYDNPAIRKIQRHVRKYVKEG